MEIHIVNTFKDQVSEETEYVVIAILLKEGKENAELQKILKNVPAVGQTETNKTVQLDINNFFTNENNSYFYKGSLTTSPYKESVNWIVLAAVKKASREQIQKLNEFEHNNARHVQALFGREVNFGSWQ